MSLKDVLTIDERRVNGVSVENYFVIRSLTVKVNTSETLQAKMPALRLRNGAAHSIRNAVAFVNNPNFAQLLEQAVQNRLDYLNQVWARFQENHKILVQQAVEAEDDEGQQLHNELFDEIEELYLEIRNVITTRIHELQQPPELADDVQSNGGDGNENAAGNDGANANDNQNNQNILNVQNNQQQQQQPIAQPVKIGQQPAQVQLQPIILRYGADKKENTWGEFNGNLTQWQGFNDRFKTVHDDPDITAARKFQLLQCALTVKAAKALGEWQLTDNNFAEAWNRLNQLFSQKYQTSKELLWKFNSLQKLERPLGPVLQKFSSVTHEVICQLRALEYPVQHYDLMCVHGLHDRLDPETSKAWELERAVETPSLEQMLNFLDRQAKALCGAYFAEKKGEGRNKTESKGKSYNGNRFEPSAKTKIRRQIKKDKKKVNRAPKLSARYAKRKRILCINVMASKH